MPAQQLQHGSILQLKYLNIHVHTMNSTLTIIIGDVKGINMFLLPGPVAALARWRRAFEQDLSPRDAERP